MKKTLLTIVGATVLIGAGCSSPSVIKTSSTIPLDVTAPRVPANPVTTKPKANLNKSNPKTMTWSYPGILPDSEVNNKQVRIKTSKGEIVFDLLPKVGPRAASNFVYLVKNKFYDGLTFHRVVPGFVIQGGDPLGNGTGGPGYKFADDSVSLPYTAGIVAMANSGANTNGSQFFIMLADNFLPPSYSIFGRVTLGAEVVQKIQVGEVMTTVVVENK